MPIKFAKQKETQEESFTTVPDKLYAVTGFEYIHKEDEEPCFRPNVFEQLVVLIKFLTANGEEGPAMSVSPAELVCLVNAFGVEFKPDPKRIMDIDTLLEAKEKAHGKQLSVESVGGWAKNFKVDWLHPPEDRYTVQFKRIQKHDEGEYEYKVVNLAGKDPWEFIPLVFEIVGDENGKPSPFNGYEIQAAVSNVWVVSQFDEETGESVSIEEIGFPLLAPGVNGERWLALLDYFVPQVHEHEWLRNDSPLGVDELYNPQYVILSELQKSNKTIVVYCEGDKRKNWGFDLKNVKQMNKKPEKPAEPVTLQTWVDLINSIPWEEEVFASVSPLEFTQYGKDNLAKEYLDDRGPIKGWWNRAELPETRNFDTLTEEEITRLIEVTKNSMGL